MIHCPAQAKFDEWRLRAGEHLAGNYPFPGKPHKSLSRHLGAGASSRASSMEGPGRRRRHEVRRADATQGHGHPPARTHLSSDSRRPARPSGAELKKYFCGSRPSICAAERRCRPKGRDNRRAPARPRGLRKRKKTRFGRNRGDTLRSNLVTNIAENAAAIGQLVDSNDKLQTKENLGGEYL